MTLEDVPTMLRFMRLYWNQMGPDMYGSVVGALRDMLTAGGEEIAQPLRREFIRRGTAPNMRNGLLVRSPMRRSSLRPAVPSSFPRTCPTS